MVSIPNRDFDELQSSRGILGACCESFQSLIGILMNCNPGLLMILLSWFCVSIPNRDFDELQCNRFQKQADCKRRFQSLIGILMNCNQVARMKCESINHRFNP